MIRDSSGSFGSLKFGFFLVGECFTDVFLSHGMKNHHEQFHPFWGEYFWGFFFRASNMQTQGAG